MKIKYFVFCLVLFGLSGLPASSSAKSTTKSNWQSFQLQYQSSETAKMLVGWNKEKKPKKQNIRKKTKKKGDEKK